MNGISLSGMFSLELIKKSRFSGSYNGMRYMLMMEDGKMRANVYPEPYCWEATPDEQKKSEFFEYSKDGIEKMTAWLNEQYESAYKKEDS